MVTQKVEETVVAGEAAAQEDPALIVADLSPAVIFVDAIDVDRGHAVDGSHDQDAVSVVDKSADGCTALLVFGQSVFVIEINGVGCAANRAIRLVAIGVVAIGVAKGCGDGVGLAGAVGVTVAIVVGNVADGVVGVRIAVLTRTHSIGAGGCQPAVQPVIAKALHLAAVGEV